MQEIISQNITISNTPEEIPLAILSLENFAQNNEIPLSIIERVNVVINELLLSIMQHSFPKNKQGDINITLMLFDTGKLAIKLIDQGKPFNPFELSSPKYNSPSKYKNIGSLGLHLVRKCMDEYSYKRSIDRNIIIMSKNQI